MNLPGAGIEIGLELVIVPVIKVIPEYLYHCQSV